jgi:hypothetical protein
MTHEPEAGPAEPLPDPRSPAWFGVRTVFHHCAWPDGSHGPSYEERVTLWRAKSHEDAIALAVKEAEEYSRPGYESEMPVNYVGLAQSYELPDRPHSGAEIFSLIRYSDLAPTAYLDHFFDTGDEVQRHSGE